MSRQTRRPWREWLPTGLSDGGKKKAGRSRSAGRRLARLEYLEDRRLLSFEPTAQAQELLFHMNRMRVDPQGELDVLFSSIDPLVARDPGANAAIKYFNDPTTAEILSEWQSLSPTAPLAWNESLHNAATAHSLLMKQQDTQSHQLSGEDPLGTRITNAGYTNWSGVAENIFAYAESPFHAHCAFVIDWGVASRGHRENIMDPFYREVGIGIAEDTSSSTSVGPLLVTQDFGNRYGLSQAFMIGAAFADADGDASYDVGEGLSEVQVTATGAAGTFTTTTMSAGGWQLQLPAGDYTVTAAGGTFAGTGRVAVHVGSDNVEVDFLSGLGTGYVNFDLWEITAEPLGTVDFLEMPGVHPDAEPLWYQFQAAYSGLLTVDATYDSLGGSAQLVLYDSAGAELDRSAADGGYQRVDATVTAGETYLLEVSGTSPTVDLRLVNLVERNGSSVSVHGTAEADSLVFDAADGPNLSIRGLSYDFGGGQVTVFSFDGTGGNDDVRVIGGTGADQATLHPTSGTFTGQGYSLSVVNIESIDYDGGEGADTVTLWGSTGANIYTADPGRGEMTGDGVSISATAETIYARGNGGSDTVYFTDSEGDDLLQYYPRWAIMSGEGYFNQVNAFKVMYADAERGAGG
ncbi:MAG: hypothetical protein GXY83_43685, partial [Rhodopirellula sp.]|nr:hypothetical protein [Rhodopirellula sp.]